MTTKEGEKYATIHIAKVQAGQFGAKCTPYFTLTVRDKKHELEDHGQTQSAVWNSVGITFDIADEKDIKGEIRVTFWSRDKWKKDKYLGEASLPFSTILMSASHSPQITLPVMTAGSSNALLVAPKDADSSSFPLNSNSRVEESPIELVLVNEKKKKKEDAGEKTAPVYKVRLYIEVTGWKVVYNMMTEISTAARAVANLIGVADSKSTKKSRTYIRKDMLQLMKKLVEAPETSPELKEQIAIAWGKLVKKDDESLLNMVNSGAIRYLAKLIAKTKEPKVQALFIETLKAFFKYVVHQQALIKRGIMESLIKLISSEHLQVQTKCFEVLLHFDAIHQIHMIKYGILPRLNKLIFVDNLQIQTRALAMIQYFDAIHQEEMIKQGMLPQLLKLISLDKSQLQLKALAVIQHFDVKYHDLMIKEGLLKHLVWLIASDNLPLRLKAFEVTQGFVETHQIQLIQDGILKKLFDFIKEDNLQIQMKSLDLISRFDPSYTIQEGFLKYVNELISATNPDLQSKAFEIILTMDVTHQEEMIQEGIINQLIELIAIDEEPTQIEEFDQFDEITNVQDLKPISEKEEQKGDTFYLDLEDMYPSLNANPNLTFSANPDSPNAKWSCSACTFLNSSNMVSCAICATAKPFNAFMPSKHQDSLNQALSYPPSMDMDVNSASSIETKEDSWGEENWGSVLKVIASNEQENFVENFSPHGAITPIESEEIALLTESREQSVMVQTSSNQDISALSNFTSEFPLAQPVVDTLLIAEPQAIEQLALDELTPQIESSSITGMEMGKEPREQDMNKKYPEQDTILTEDQIEKKEEVIKEGLEGSVENPPWSCTTCTFLNYESNADICEVCGTQRVTLVLSPSSIPTLDLQLDLNRNKKEEEIEKVAVVVPSIESPVAEEEAKVEKKSLTDQQMLQVLEVLRSFDVKYQKQMTQLKIFKYLKKLMEIPALQHEVIKTISYFDVSCQAEMITEGILTRLIQLISKKNAKIFLLVIERFEAYQDELMKEGMLKPLIKLLSVDDVQIHTRISDFLMNFDDSYRKDIARHVKEITNVTSHNLRIEDTNIPPPPPYPSPNEICTLCGGIGIHLATCALRRSFKFGKIPLPSQPVNYGLMTQARKLLWQLENKGIRLLKYKVIYNDGGEYSRKCRVKNLTVPQSSVYSSEAVSVANIVFEYAGKGIPLLTHLILKAPRLRFDSPVKTAAVFISEEPPDIKSTQGYDKMTASQFEDLSSSGELQARDPVAFLDLGDGFYAEAPLSQPSKAKYILLKLLTAAKKTFDVEYIGFVGTSISDNKSEKNYLQILDLDPRKIDDVGNHLGVRKRVKRIDYGGDFVSGLLYWIGTNGGEKSTWENPVTSAQVSVTTSHAMYSIGMKVEDIIGREGGTSCYWGGSVPQFFILDLKHRRLRCNYFTLRHGYQAANSYIQNWEFAGSHDTINWSTLYEGAETPFSRAFDTKSWPVQDGKDYFRYFRILQKGNYSMGKGISGGGSAYLCIAGFELYGELLRD